MLNTDEIDLVDFGALAINAVVLKLCNLWDFKVTIKWISGAKVYPQTKYT